ncbi:topoisomerase II-associated protein PAT1 [Phlyctochytrium arcticum]|nr:topoisomerase II-associated protein PAT1 [Phlyctochytrium arcticum]
MGDFFGFDATMPGRPNKRGAGEQSAQRGRGRGGAVAGRGRGGGGPAPFDNLGGGSLLDDSLEGSAIDDLLEQKFAFGAPQDIGLEENGAVRLEDDNEDLNDETFGSIGGPDQLGRDFDFSEFSGNHNPLLDEHPARSAYKPPLPLQTFRAESSRGSVSQRGDAWGPPPMTEDLMRRPSQMNKEDLAEIWSKPESPQGTGMSRSGSNTFPMASSNFDGPQRGLTLEEIEAQMMRGPRNGPNRHVGEIEAQMMAARSTMAPRPFAGQMGGPERRPMGLEELESVLRSQQLQAGQVAGPGLSGQQPLPLNMHMPGQQMDQQRHRLPHQQSQHPHPMQQQQSPHLQQPMYNAQARTPPLLHQGIDERSMQHVQHGMNGPGGQAYNQQHQQSRNNMGQRPPMQLGQFLPPQHRDQYARSSGNGQRGPGHQQQNQRGGYQQQNDRRQYQDRRFDMSRPREERYRGMMNNYEKELIAKIQISQLVTDDPLRDDFYHNVFTKLKAQQEPVPSTGQSPETANASSKLGLNWQQSMLLDQAKAGAAGGLAVTNRMQQQMQRLIDGRKVKPKGASLSLEGALGKISLSSVRNPRQMLQLNGANAVKDQEIASSLPTDRLSRTKVLRRTEAIYSTVLDLEVLKRRGPVDEEDVIAWTAAFEEKRVKLWNDLGVAEPVQLHFPHPFIAILAFDKGKRIIPRVFRFLNRDQQMHVITTLLSRLEGIDVCNPSVASKSATDVFVASVVPTVVSVLMDVPLFIINTCMRILLERHNMNWLAKSKPGLAFLTMFLSRAEMLKQGAVSGGPASAGASEQDLAMWTDIYNFLFASLHNHFGAIFTPAPTSPISPSSSNFVDDVYVWQFLAAMAVGATTADHQRVLLIEVRDKVLETSRRSDDVKGVANVNLFLNALGLGIDASQLAGMTL